VEFNRPGNVCYAVSPNLVRFPIFSCVDLPFAFCEISFATSSSRILRFNIEQALSFTEIRIFNLIRQRSALIRRRATSIRASMFSSL